MKACYERSKLSNFLVLLWKARFKVCFRFESSACTEQQLLTGRVCAACAVTVGAWISHDL